MARKNGLREREGADALQAELDAQRRDRRGSSEAPLKGYLEVSPWDEVCRANARSDQRWITWGGRSGGPLR